MLWRQIDLPYQRDGSQFFKQLLTRDCPVWLDSCAHAQLGRYDVFAADPYDTLTQTDDGVIHSSLNNLNEKDTDFLEVLSKRSPVVFGQAGDFSFSGAIGYFSYEFGVKRAGIACLNASPHGAFDAWFGLYAWAVVLDHHLGTATLVYCAERNNPSLGISDIELMWRNSQKTKSSARNFELTKPFQSNISYAQYEENFTGIQAHLKAGNTYQVNYSHCFSAPFDGDAFDAYLLLRQKNPSEFAAFMRLPFGDVLSFSPELLVRASDNQLLTKPIKGTAARSFDEEKDKHIQQTLKKCPKNGAENTMIVDLLRNDLSRVANIDSVHVDAFLDVETLPSVFHLVSTVSATLSSHLTYFDALHALLPGGSITGAPKHRTMQIIESLESQTRGIYCGSIGYLSTGRDMCFNIAIRTITAANGRLFCNAGGGIVLDSSVMDEYKETFDKVTVLTETLQQFSRSISEASQKAGAV